MKLARYFFVLTVVGALIMYNSCKKTNDPVLPTVNTESVSNITQTTADCGGSVISNGGSTVTGRGLCWSTLPDPTVADKTTTDGTGTGAFQRTLVGLFSSTTYYIRAYAINEVGTTYGNEVSFGTLPGGAGDTVSDIDGNLYHIITLGKQDWLKENLKATHYSKGEGIHHVVGDSEWASLDKGAYCNYDKNPANADTYGRLYNWFAVEDSRNICPQGWHVPTKDDWQSLIDYLGGTSISGGKMKSTGTLQQGTGLWEEPNTGGTNESEFTALPGGARDQDGSYSMLTFNASFWSASTNGDEAWNHLLTFKYATSEQNSNHKKSGFSVRCIKDK